MKVVSYLLKIFFNALGALLKKTYKYQDDTYPNWRYVQFFFFQKILLFNFSVPWPVHHTSFITGFSKIKLGKMTSPGSSPFQYMQATNGIEIGDNVQFAAGVQLISANHDFSDYRKSIKCRPIKIGSDVWVGANVIILPGVHIGDNVVIGAGSVVTKDIPENSVAVGNPCKVIKQKDRYGKKTGKVF